MLFGKFHQICGKTVQSGAEFLKWRRLKVYLTVVWGLDKEDQSAITENSMDSSKKISRELNESWTHCLKRLEDKETFITFRNNIVLCD